MLALSVLVAACASTVQPVEIAVRPAPELPRPPEKAMLPPPAPVREEPVRFVVLTPKTVPGGRDWMFIALTPGAYAAMARNRAEIQRWVRDAVHQIEYYRGRP